MHQCILVNFLHKAYSKVDFGCIKISVAIFLDQSLLLSTTILNDYACLQVLVNDNPYMAQNTNEKHPKSICSSMLSCCFEAGDVKKYMQKHHAC